MFRFPVPPPARRTGDWPFWFDSRQRARLRRLRRLRDAWGEDAVIQIYGGSVRIRDDIDDRRCQSEAALWEATARHQRESLG
ncbi:hypothetical protein R75461_05001 [Paraburkholderia nemoris]|uniref:hypothetical protein n=1 Tax=Paraburkholderia nemoris TaxID=2793076 RepID=UPI00190BCB8B|nr:MULTISPECIES: hypothetical protein [Paraburkholderia]MBK3780782.1 hypothetical protein [Paraburkholderia aspalathi]CAE6797006.1 hypothetical protein R75461_05001 [Paraburkholderia nemoris]